MNCLSKRDHNVNIDLNTDFIASAQRTILLEHDAIKELHDQIDDEFSSACKLILHCKGRLIITGMGKSGHIGKKMAATFASTGTPSFFVHPGEASHGDMGMITQNDVIIALSNSGETSEVTQLLPLLKRIKVPLISMTGNPQSSLANAGNCHLNTHVKKEACPLNLAPTSSTTATLVMGDALAVALLEARGFTENDFAFSHPGGSLGRKLLLKVEDIMHSGEEMPIISIDALLPEALYEMTSKGLGITTITNHEGILQGIFTDGDLRRIMPSLTNIQACPIKNVMTLQGKSIPKDMLVAEALSIMEQNSITALAVLKQSHLVGVVTMHDILKSGIV
jgi:arabinose-5-phosphate isomerase